MCVCVPGIEWDWQSGCPKFIILWWHLSRTSQRPPLSPTSLQHFCLHTCPDACPGKAELGSVGNPLKTMSPFSLRIRQSEPRGLLDKQVCGQHGRGGHLSQVRQEGCAPVSSPPLQCSLSDKDRDFLLVPSHPCSKGELPPSLSPALSLLLSLSLPCLPSKRGRVEYCSQK